MNLNGNKIAAFSILESIVAMVIVMLAFGITTLLIVKVNQSNFNRKAELILFLQQSAQTSALTKQFINKEEYYKEYRIESKFQLLEENTKLVHIVLEAINEQEETIVKWEEITRLN